MINVYRNYLKLSNCFYSKILFCLTAGFFCNYCEFKGDLDIKKVQNEKTRLQFRDRVFTN
jgi:hypothetical protein